MLGLWKSTSYSALTVGSWTFQAARKLEPVHWHFILVSNTKAAGILVFYLSPLLKGTHQCFWLSKHLNQQLPAAQPGAMAAAGTKAQAGGKEAGDCEFSGSTEAKVRGGGWFTRTPGDTHKSVSQQQNPQKALLPHKARHGPSNQGIKAGQREILLLWAAAGAKAFAVSLSDDRHAADDDGVWLEADQLGRPEGNLASLLAAQKQENLAWGGMGWCKVTGLG